MKKPAMPHPGHEKHLCYLANLHFHQSNWQEYKHMVKDARYVCKECGRSAADKHQLCKPAKLG